MRSSRMQIGRQCAASSCAPCCPTLEGLCLRPSHVSQQVCDLQALPSTRQPHCRGKGCDEAQEQEARAESVDLRRTERASAC